MPLAEYNRTHVVTKIHTKYVEMEFFMQSIKKFFTLSACLFFFSVLSIGCSKKTKPVYTDSLGQAYDLSADYLVTQYADFTGQHGSFYTIENDQSLIIIDGGWNGNADFVRSVIADHNNTVDAWIISHPHQDHAGAFNAIAADLQDIKIKQIYDNGFDYDFIKASGEPYDDILIMETYHTLTADADNVTHLRRGDEFTICGLTVTVLNAFDDIVIEQCGGEKDYQNNASLMLRITNKTDSILFCSDIKYDMERYFSSISEQLLSCKYVQTGHHGNWSFSEDFYLNTNADVFFFDAPSAITENPDYPASSLKQSLSEKKKTVQDFATAPNFVVLK